VIRESTLCLLHYLLHNEYISTQTLKPTVLICEKITQECVC